jgi:hypothetical protein
MRQRGCKQRKLLTHLALGLFACFLFFEAGKASCTVCTLLLQLAQAALCIPI